MLEAWALVGDTNSTVTTGNAIAPTPIFCNKSRRVTPAAAGGGIATEASKPSFDSTSRANHTTCSLTGLPKCRSSRFAISATGVLPSACFPYKCSCLVEAECLPAFRIVNH